MREKRTCRHHSRLCAVAGISPDGSSGNGPLDSIDLAQITLFRNSLLFEIEQRRRFERKHGEGAFHDIRQLVADSITRPVVGERLKLAVEKAHQFVKGLLLLQLFVILCHSARLRYSVADL